MILIYKTYIINQFNSKARIKHSFDFSCLNLGQMSFDYFFTSICCWLYYLILVYMSKKAETLISALVEKIFLTVVFLLNIIPINEIQNVVPKINTIINATISDHCNIKIEFPLLVLSCLAKLSFCSFLKFTR